MTHSIDIPRLRETVRLLMQVSPDARLVQLKNLCVNNGTWAIPEQPGEYHPVLYEIQLFGVSASVMDPADLPRVWMKAATNLISALERAGDTPAPSAAA